MAYIHCPKCDERISDRAKACTNCGEPQLGKNTKVCIECGIVIPARSKKCNECGTYQYEKGLKTGAKSRKSKSSTGARPFGKIVLAIVAVLAIYYLYTLYETPVESSIPNGNYELVGQRSLKTLACPINATNFGRIISITEGQVSTTLQVGGMRTYTIKTIDARNYKLIGISTVGGNEIAVSCTLLDQNRLGFQCNGKTIVFKRP